MLVVLGVVRWVTVEVVAKGQEEGPQRWRSGEGQVGALALTQGPADSGNLAEAGPPRAARIMTTGADSFPSLSRDRL